MKLGKWPTVLAGLSLVALVPNAQAISIQFDYSYDTNNFFADTARKNTLEAAGNYFSNLLTDNLNAITPTSGYDTWTAQFMHPGTGEGAKYENLHVAADTLVVFAGGMEFDGTTLGVGGPGGFSGFLNDFGNNVRTRDDSLTVSDVSGDTATDFSPWGGSISFDTDSPWYFDQDVSNFDNEISSGESDFYSVALHELGHLLGIGTADSWRNLINDSDEFIGAAAIASFGGNVPLDDIGVHWEDAQADSTVDGQAQEANMDPTIMIGSRKEFTDLDVAALEDIGWEVASDSNMTPVPLPPAAWLLGSGIAALIGFKKKAKAEKAV